MFQELIFSHSNCSLSSHRCIGDYQCTGGNTLTCQPSQPCVLRCEGEQACANSTLIPNGASSVSVECIGENACDDTEIVRESNDSRSLTINSGCVLSHTSSDPTVMPSVSPTLNPSAVPTVIPTAPTILQLFVPTPFPTPSPTATEMPTTTTSPTASPGYNDAKGKDIIDDIHEHVQKHSDSPIMIIAVVIVCLVSLCICMLCVCYCKARTSKRRQSDRAAVQHSGMSQNPLHGHASSVPPNNPEVSSTGSNGSSMYAVQATADALGADGPCECANVSRVESQSSASSSVGHQPMELQLADVPPARRRHTSTSVQMEGVAKGSVEGSAEQQQQVVTGRLSQDETPRDTDSGDV